MDTQYMEILERLKTRHLLTSSAVDSLARTSALLEKAQELRAAGPDYGDRCTELSEMSDPIMSLSKIALYLEKRGLEYVLHGLSEIGYDAQWQCLQGSFLGLQQCRERIYIIAYPVCKFGEGEPVQSVFREPYLLWELPRVYPGWGERRHLPEPRTFRSTNELPNLVDRNKCLGNAVQPLMAQYLFECIKVYDAENV